MMDDLLVWGTPFLAAVLGGIGMVIASGLLVWIAEKLLAAGLEKPNPTSVSSAAPPPAGSGLGGVMQLHRRHLQVVGRTVDLVALPCLLLAGWLALSLFFSGGERWAGGGVILVGAAVLMPRAWKQYRSSNNGYSLARLDCENRILVSRALMPLIEQGYQLYPDFQAGGVCIDHLAIGPKGVFAVDVHTRMIPADADAAHPPMIVYDGRSLCHGDERDFETIGEADKKVEQLSTWLSENLDEPVAARAVIILPGWAVKRTSPEGLSVIHPRQIASFFQHVQPRPLFGRELRQVTERIAGSYREPARQCETPIAEENPKREEPPPQ